MLRLLFPLAVIGGISCTGLHANPIAIQTTTAIDLLDAVDRRRLDHYASEIRDEIAALAQAEHKADSAGIALHKHETHRLIQRYLDSATQTGLNRQDTSQYFLSFFAQSYAGPVPKLLIDETGHFNIDHLLYSDRILLEAPDIDPNEYVSILREIGEHLND